MSTFASVRSANRAARAAEEALQVGLQPLLVPSRLQDERQKIFFMDGKHLVVEGGGAAPPTVDVFYGDYEGGQGMISRFTMQPVGDADVRWLTTVGPHWNVDRPDPRWRPR